MFNVVIEFHHAVMFPLFTVKKKEPDGNTEFRYVMFIYTVTHQSQAPVLQTEKINQNHLSALS